MAYLPTKRNGISSINVLARQLCKLVAIFAPVIRRVYPDNEALHIALDTVHAACAILVEETDAIMTEDAV